MPILEDASTQDLKRLLELFAIANLREAWPDVKGTKEELCYAVATAKDLGKIKDFVNQNLGCCKQHVYVFVRPAGFEHLPETLAGGPQVLDTGGMQLLYMVRSSYTVVLRDPLEETSLDFLWPIRVDLTDSHIILRIVVLEKAVSVYFDRPCYVADRSVDEKSILADIERICPEREDLHKGIKKLWEDGFMDSPRTKYKKATSSASEAMDEDRGIREHNPELFETLLGSTLQNTLFVIPEEKNSSVAAISADPSNGYLAFTSYFDEPDRKVAQEKVRAFMTELNTLAHSLDPSRKTVIRRCDFAKDIPDVYSPSVWAGWYSGRYTEYKASSEKEMKKVAHFIHAEWGGDSHAGRHSENPDKVISQIASGGRTDERGLDYLLTGGQTRASKDGDWSESYICNLFDWHLKEQETMEWLTGSAQWVFKDFSTPLRPENPVPRMNQKGLVERDLTPKEGYYVFQSYWPEKPMAHIYGHSWPMRWGNEGESKVVKVYSNCPSAELFVNGVSCGTKTRNSQDFPAAGLRWMVKLDEGNNEIRVVAQKGAVKIVDEITTFYQTRKWGKPTHVELSQAEVDGLIRIEAWLRDTGGILCVDDQRAALPTKATFRAVARKGGNSFLTEAGYTWP